jgi:hypothetical protein
MLFKIKKEIMKKENKNSKSKRSPVHLVFAIKESTFLKKKAIGKELKDLKPSDFKSWVRKFWWGKTSGAHIQQKNKMLDKEMQNHIFKCIYGIE